MTRIKYLDVEVDLPGMRSEQVAPSDPVQCISHFRLEGGPAEEAIRKIKAAALQLGYVALPTATDKDLVLSRGEAILHLYHRDEGTVEIDVDDAEKLPMSRIVPNGIALGKLTIRLPELEISPGRERHVAGSTEWFASWKVVGADARTVQSTVLASLAEDGFKSTPPLGPRELRIGSTWGGEAQSKSFYLRSNAEQLKDHVLLELNLFESERADRIS